jgi:hypothetical protein
MPVARSTPVQRNIVGQLFRRPSRAEPDPQAGQVYSLAAARLRKHRARHATEKPRPTELVALDLRGLDLDRMTSGAREHFWFNLNRYARQLFGAASELSRLQAGEPDVQIAAEHVKTAESRRMREARRAETRDAGLVLLLDALQIVGAAVCGALATRPESIGGGAIPLVVALVLTVSLFVLREALATRAS